MFVLDLHFGVYSISVCDPCPAVKYTLFIMINVVMAVLGM